MSDEEIEARTTYVTFELDQLDAALKAGDRDALVASLTRLADREPAFAARVSAYLVRHVLAAELAELAVEDDR